MMRLFFKASSLGMNINCIIKNKKDENEKRRKKQHALRLCSKWNLYV